MSCFTLLLRVSIRANGCIAFVPPVNDDDYYQAVPGFGKSKHLQNAAEYFSKVYLYYNSRLPAQLPPLRLYVPFLLRIDWLLTCVEAYTHQLTRFSVWPHDTRARSTRGQLDQNGSVTSMRIGARVPRPW